MRIEDIKRGDEVSIIEGPYAGSHGTVTRVGPPVVVRFADGANGGPGRLLCPPETLAPYVRVTTTEQRHA